MFKFCAGHGNRFRHLWIEVYIRMPHQRTLILMWTRGMWRTAHFSGLSYREITGSL